MRGRCAAARGRRWASAAAAPPPADLCRAPACACRPAGRPSKAGCPQPRPLAAPALLGSAQAKHAPVAGASEGAVAAAIEAAPPKKKTRIVVLGSGWGAVAFLKNLDWKGAFGRELPLLLLRGSGEDMHQPACLRSLVQPCFGSKARPACFPNKA